jgi:hypothetical protein
VIDTNQGDPGHPGVSEIANSWNQQANASLQNYSYSASSNAVDVGGRICGARFGSGAVFERTYRAFLTAVVPWHVSAYARGGAGLMPPNRQT